MISKALFNIRILKTSSWYECNKLQQYMNTKTHSIYDITKRIQYMGSSNFANIGLQKSYHISEPQKPFQYRNSKNLSKKWIQQTSSI